MSPKVSFAYTQNNPVMYTDISGYAPEWLKAYWKWVRKGYKNVGEALSEEFMVDFSWSFPLKITGPTSLSVGVLENYDKPGDYRGRLRM